MQMRIGGSQELPVEFRGIAHGVQPRRLLREDGASLTPVRV
jgi:hypothetical protein